MGHFSREALWMALVPIGILVGGFLVAIIGTCASPGQGSTEPVARIVRPALPNPSPPRRVERCAHRCSPGRPGR
jgi:hypothetical protein